MTYGQVVYRCRSVAAAHNFNVESAVDKVAVGCAVVFWLFDRSEDEAGMCLQGSAKRR
jgi:hypothetical protein